MLIKDKGIASHQLLLIKQDRVLVNQLKLLASLISESGIFFLFFYFFTYFSKKMGWSVDGKRNILLG